MAFYKTLLLTFAFSFRALGGGMPVVDTNEIRKQISDALYMTTALSGLLSEVGVDGVSEGALQSLQTELQLYQSEIQDFQNVRGAIDQISHFPVERSQVFARQIENITSYLRSVQSAVSLAATLGARPEALSASIEMLSNQQEQERLRIETALKVLDEKERIRQQRMKLRKRSEMSKAIASEIRDIRRLSGNKTVAPVEARNNSESRERMKLW